MSTQTRRDDPLEKRVETVGRVHPRVEIKHVDSASGHDERFGEEVGAWIVARDAAGLTADDVRRFCGERAARSKVPRYVRFVDSFPLTVTGKVLKFRMREQELEELGRALPGASG